VLLFYIDESGTGLGDERTPFFVLTAAAIPAHDWQTVDGQIAALKRRLVGWAKPEDFEIKGRDLRRGEKFFKSLSWEQRAQGFRDIAQLIAHLPCQIFAVRVDKRDLPDYVKSETGLYRLAFWRLLDELDAELSRVEQPGLLMVDMRSDMHSSVQDRRLIDAYREWLGSRAGETRFVDLPWFGFSAFYAGLQIADFTAYLIDFTSNEEQTLRRSREIIEAFDVVKSRVRLIQIP
jgi:hypothetical protein